MRLIDADELPRQKITIKNEWHMHEEVEVVYADDIDNAPTIDPFKGKSLEQLMDECFNEGYRKGAKTDGGEE